MALEKMLQTGGLGLLLAGCAQELGDTATDAQNYVVVDPAQPTSRDTLTCLMAGNGSVYDFLWFVNDEGVYSSSGQTSSLSPEYTTSGDAVTCSIWKPADGYSDPFELGSETVYIR